MRYIFILSSFLFVVLILGCLSPHIAPLNVHVARQPGFYLSPNGQCKALLEVSERGGFLNLSIKSTSDGASDVSRDISGITWISRNELVYTVGPIYGRPGIFLFNCDLMQTKQILGAKTIKKGYPSGADYFELQGFSSNKIYFYYSPDVDLVDFNRFRDESFLYQINLDGTELGKAHK